MDYRTNAKPIELGNIVKDCVTGFQGVAIGYSVYINQCPRWTIQPQEKKDGKPIDARSFDEPDVEFVEKTNLRVLECVRPEEPIELGDTVRDDLSGLEGRVDTIVKFLAGCVRVGVRPRELKDGLPVTETYFDEIHLSVVKRANPKPAKVATGGPRAEPMR